MTDRPERVKIKALKEVGRYALGIEWAEGHESILPYRHLRQHCPCEACRDGVGRELPSTASQVADFRRLGETTLFFQWRDGHESLFVAEELRALCRCAYCVGEPEYPITGR